MPPRESFILSFLFGIVPLVASDVAHDENSVGPLGGIWPTNTSGTAENTLPQFGPGSYPSEDPDFISTITLGVTAYTGFIAYSGDTPRRDATLLGGGATVTLGKASLDLDFQRIDIRLNNGTDIQQLDGTAALAWIDADYAVRVFHHFSYDEKTSERTMSAYGFGFTTFPSWRWRAGMEVTWSQLSLSDTTIHTAQAIPFVSWTWWQNDHWNLAQDLSALSIATEDATSRQGDKYFSADSTLGLGWKSFRLTVNGWAGERRFAIVNQGFAAYNLPVTYDHGYGLSFAWYSAHTMVQLQAQRQSFQHDGASGKALSDSLILLFNVSF